MGRCVSNTSSLIELQVSTAAWDTFDEVGAESMNQPTRKFLFEAANDQVDDGGFMVELEQDQALYRTRADGTGALVWGSSFALAELLHRQGVPVEMKQGQPVQSAPLSSFTRILELGAGLGLVSIALTKSTATPSGVANRVEIVATDGVEEVLEKLQSNAKANLTPEDMGRFQPMLLEWGGEVRPSPCGFLALFRCSSTLSWHAFRSVTD